MALSQKTKETLLGPLNANNPVVVQVLGICSALAVTVQLKPALVMGIAVTIIVAMSNVIISLLRNTIPMRIRIIVQLVVVAALVTHHELYSDGTFGGIRHDEQTSGFVPRWSGQWSGLCLDSGGCGLCARVVRLGYAARLPHHP